MLGTIFIEFPIADLSSQYALRQRLAVCRDRFHSAFRVGASGNFQIRTMGPGPFPYRMESCKELR